MNRSKSIYQEDEAGNRYIQPNSFLRHLFDAFRKAERSEKIRMQKAFPELFIPWPKEAGDTLTVHDKESKQVEEVKANHSPGIGFNGEFWFSCNNNDFKQCEWDFNEQKWFIRLDS